MILFQIHTTSKAIPFLSKDSTKIHFQSRKIHFSKMKIEILLLIKRILFKMTRNSRIEITHLKMIRTHIKVNLEILFQIQMDNQI